MAQTAPSIQRAQVRRQTARLARARWQLYIMLVLPIIYFLVFHYAPMLGLQIAFKRFSISHGVWGSPWAGFYHFERFFRSYQFRRVISNTLELSFYRLAASFPTPVLFALCLNVVRVRWFKKTVQMVTYIPHFISVIVIVGILMQMFNPRIGVYGVAYKALTGKNAPDLFGIPSAFKHMFVWSGIWQNLGWRSIIYLAALSGVDPQLHESAMVDGANRFKRMLVLDVPAILPTATILLIMDAGQIMSIGFEKVFLLQNDLNRSKSEVISTFVYQVSMGSSGNDFSYGTAIGLFNSVINLTLITAVNAFSRQVSETSLW
ncbi:MAG: ABC transporter permease [Christensenellales bacterium]|jgi:putative aldouronate transport system permease protein